MTALILAACTMSFAQAKPKPKTTALSTSLQTMVKNLYAEHKVGKGPFGNKPNRASIDKYFTKELGDLIWKAVNSEEGLNVDPLYNAQDFDIKALTVSKADENNMVKVNFRNFLRDEEITFSFTRANTASKVYRIDSIVYSDAEDLQTTLEMSDQTYVPAAIDGDYLVGEVKCGIESNLAGFWARVKCEDQPNIQIIDMETLTFGTFNPKEKGRRGQFVFTDDKFTAGEFIDKSGKKFKVVRVKTLM